MKKPIPTFNTDKQAEDFVATADLSQYDLSGGRMIRFELTPKNASVNPRPHEAAVRAIEDMLPIELTAEASRAFADAVLSPREPTDRL